MNVRRSLSSVQGTAGSRCYRAAKKAGAAVVLIESGVYGIHVCSRRCMPSKLLIGGSRGDAHVGARPRFGRSH
jgi:pyruvate/2-oxoglutarate dehydrogenase complex dihydrolipoamide dehydrogenase (E3) component